jgi:hypothetical protein
MANNTGTATIDFGAAPGLNETSVAVTGQGTISATSKAEAYFMADDTATGHTAADHRYAASLMGLTCGTPSAGTGFTIYARSEHKHQGQFSIRWVWAD